MRLEVSFCDLLLFQSCSFQSSSVNAAAVPIVPLGHVILQTGMTYAQVLGIARLETTFCCKHWHDVAIPGLRVWLWRSVQHQVNHTECRHLWRLPTVLPMLGLDTILIVVA